MKNTQFLEEEDVDIKDYTVILPSVSVGNVGQLAVDLLLHNLPVRLLGAFDHPSVHPLVGMVPDGERHLMTAIEAFVCDIKKLVIIQIRSPISLTGRLSLLFDLLDWAAGRGVAALVQLASCHAAGRPDPAAPQLCRITTTAAASSPQPPAPPLSPPVDTGDISVPGSGFVTDLYRACEARQFPYTCLLRHTYEGNNTPEAVDLCECVDSWLQLTEKGAPVRPGPLGRWRVPPTWSHLFGSGLDSRLF